MLNTWYLEESYIAAQHALEHGERRLKQLARRKKLLTFAIAISILIGVAATFYAIGLVVFSNMPDLV